MPFFDSESDDDKRKKLRNKIKNLQAQSHSYRNRVEENEARLMLNLYACSDIYANNKVLTPDSKQQLAELKDLEQRLSASLAGYTKMINDFAKQVVEVEIEISKLKPALDVKTTASVLLKK